MCADMQTNTTTSYEWVEIVGRSVESESERRMKGREKLQGLCVVTLPVLLLRESLSSWSLHSSSQRMDDFHSHTPDSAAEEKNLQEDTESQTPPRYCTIMQ